MAAHISSPKNQRVRAVARLSKPRERTDRGLLVVEGAQLLGQALAAGWVADEVFYVPHRMAAADHEVLASAEVTGAAIIQVTDPVLGRMSRRDGPLSCIATVVRRELSDLRRLRLPATPLLVVAQAIEKPGNLGVIARSASAAGADALVVSDPRTDVLGPGCVHASLGSVFSLPIAVTDSDSCLRWLQGRGITPVVTSPHARSSYTRHDLTAPAAIVVGNEHTGVTGHWLASGTPVRIDMVGPMNSLNASVAAAVLLFEAVRQRGRSHADDDPGGVSGASDVRTRIDVRRGALLRASA